MSRRGVRALADWKQQWWTCLIQDTVDLAVRRACGEADGLGAVAIFMPPQHGKSAIATMIAPAYGFARNPDLRTMLLTYGREFSARGVADTQTIMGDLVYKHLAPARFGRERAVVQDERGRLREVSMTAEDKSLMMRVMRQDPNGAVHLTKGYYLASSPRSSVTGWAYELGILDDLIKNPEDAFNAALRDKLAQTVKSVFFTRRQGRSAMILIMTRWHHQDIAEMLTSRWAAAGTPHAIITLPALAAPDPSRPYDRRPAGAVLDPIRYGEDWYREQQALLDDPDLWAALYEQRPRIKTGVQFMDEHWGEFDPVELRKPDRIDRLGLSIDANNIAEGSSFAQVDVWALVRGDAGYRESWKVHEVRDKWDLPELVRQVQAQIKAWPITDVLVEAAASGPNLVAFLRENLGPARHIVEPGTYCGRTYAIEVLANGGRPIRVHLLPHFNTPHEIRVEAGSAYITTGVCKLPRRPMGQITTHWISPHKEEFRRWPYAKNDDRVDTATQWVRWCSAYGLRPRWEALDWGTEDPQHP